MFETDFQFPILTNIAVATSSGFSMFRLLEKSALVGAVPIFLYCSGLGTFGPILPLGRY